MAPSLTYSLADVLSVAKIHPFYHPSVQYPPDDDTILTVREHAALNPTQVSLKAHPLLRKNDLYVAIERLVNDISPENTYRHNVYTSITGGGGTNSQSLFFATDALENRKQRAVFGQLLQNTGLIKRGDWVLTTHCAGQLYRSLDLTLEIMENAGATTLSAGNHMSPAQVVQLLTAYHVNVLTGDGSQVVQVVHYISTLLDKEREAVKLEKIVYTSEGLTPAQKAHIRKVLGSVKICSVLGSAEAGPYGLSSPDLTDQNIAEGFEDFIIDTRMTLIEILPLSFVEGDIVPGSLPEGQTGIVVQTSLSRLRNPLVRYLTGDVGSIHPLPEKARSLIPESHWPYLRVFRLRGRDRRFSFSWDGEYIQFEKLTALMSGADLGVLQWQVILDKAEPSQEALLEVRLLCSRGDDGERREKTISDCIRSFFTVYSSNQHRFKLTFVDAISGFELSKTGGKVIKFIDRFNEEP